MWDFVSRVLSRDDASKEAAKERLRLVLIQDRSSVSPQLLDTLRSELIDTVSQYMEIDERSLEFDLEQSDESVALVANIPIRSVRRAAER